MGLLDLLAVKEFELDVDDEDDEDEFDIRTLGESGEDD